MSWTNTTKNTASFTNQTKNSATVANQSKYKFLLIDDSYFLLIDSTYKLRIGDAGENSWSNQTKN